MTYYTSSDDIDFFATVAPEAFFDITVEWHRDEQNRSIAQVSAVLSHVKLGELEVKRHDCRKVFGNRTVEPWEEDAASGFDAQQAAADERDEAGDAAFHAMQDSARDAA